MRDTAHDKLRFDELIRMAEDVLIADHVTFIETHHRLHGIQCPPSPAMRSIPRR
ncbi:hypothetical protein ACQ859_19705 [Roseateles chitinivorans]|uniref:hypothetical protein n=1 Tax=Roseateles chitinivorans TaxID=2917965 RepID=UPI003D66EC49